jgi:serine/threonine protein kinase
MEERDIDNKKNRFDSEATEVPDNDFELDQTEIPTDDFDTDRTEIPDNTDIPNDYDLEKTDVPNGNINDDIESGNIESVDKNIKGQDSIYIIDEKEYQYSNDISTGISGEADIILVNNDNKPYALKLYKGNRQPNTKILEKVKTLKDSGFIIPVYSFGYCTRKNDGITFTYELMEYIGKPSLAQFVINHNENIFRKIAINAAVCIDLCHKKGILHKDIKPGNFFLTDINKGSLLIADFGVSTLLDENGYSYTKQSGTTTYNAPEMYNADGNRVRLTAKTDFYALGITLMSIWMGESKFRAEMGDKMDKDRIFDLRKKKAKGELPYPTDLSNNLLLLIKGLTVPDEENRWGFEEIIKWSTGKLKMADMAITIHDKPFIFNESLSKVAHSPEELAKYMTEDRYYALKILKRGKVSEWLHACNRDNLSTNIDEIIDNERDDNACVMRSVYLLDPDMPLYGHDNNPCRTLEEIGNYIMQLSNNDKVITEMGSDFYCFLQSHEREDLCNECKRIIAGNLYNPQWEIATMLNPSLPFIVYNDKGISTNLNTADDIVNHFRDLNCIVSKEMAHTLVSDSFSKWLKVRDGEAYLRIKEQMAENNSVFDYWCILYNLDLNRSYELTLSSDEGTCHKTYDEILELLNDIIISHLGNRTIKSREIRQMFLIADDGTIAVNRMYYYLKSKGKNVEEMFTFIKDCYKDIGINSSKRCIAYTEDIAMFKALKGLMGKDKNPRYLLNSSGKSITSLSDLSKIQKEEFRNEIDDKHLTAWLSIFFHDNPFADLSKPGNFEKLTNDYLIFIGKRYPDYEPKKRLELARDSILSDINCLKRNFSFFNIARICFIFLFFVSVISIISMIMKYGIPYDKATISKNLVTLVTIGAVIGAFLGLVIVIITNLKRNEIKRIIIGALIGAASMIGIYGMMMYIPSQLNITLSGIILVITLSIIWICRKSLFYNKALYKSLVAINYDADIMYVQPAHFAFRNILDKYDYEEKESVVKGTETLRTKTKELIKWFSPSICLLIMIIGFFVYITPALGGKGLPTFKEEQELNGVWEGSFGNNDAAIKFMTMNDDSIKAVVYVTFKHSVHKSFSGVINREESTLEMNDSIDNGILDGCMIGNLNKEYTSYEGKYISDKTGKKMSFRFRKTKN